MRTVRPIMFDVDGVVANFNAPASVIAERLFPDMPPDCWPRHPRDAKTWYWHEGIPGHTKQADGMLWQEIHNTPNFWMTCEALVTVGQIGTINDLHERFGVVFVTNRPSRGENQDAGEQTRRWLKEHDFTAWDQVYQATGPKGELAAHLRVRAAIDDNGPNVLSVLEAGVKAAALSYPYNESYNDAIYAAGGIILPTLDNFLRIPFETL